MRPCLPTGFCPLRHELPGRARIGSFLGSRSGSNPGSIAPHDRRIAHNGQRIEFPTLQAMTAHLDRWAATSLTSPEQWEDALAGTRSWLDYSARNQVLLASYGIDGPVAGPETWRLVPSTTEGRGCAIRAGEHGYPVRVPITSGGTEPDPYLGGHRPTRAAVERWEWRPVFETAQLARHPAPGAAEHRHERLVDGGERDARDDSESGEAPPRRRVRASRPKSGSS